MSTLNVHTVGIKSKMNTTCCKAQCFLNLYTGLTPSRVSIIVSNYLPSMDQRWNISRVQINVIKKKHRPQMLIDTVMILDTYLS